MNYRHLRRLLGDQDERKENERFFERLREVVADTLEKRLKDLGDFRPAVPPAGVTVEPIKLAVENRAAGSDPSAEAGVGHARDGEQSSLPPPTSTPERKAPPPGQRLKPAAPGRDRDRSLQALDHPTDSESLLLAYKTALQARELGRLMSDLSLPPNAVQKIRVEAWIPAVHKGKMGFFVIPNPEFHIDDIGRQLQKLYGLTRMDKAPIEAWTLLAPAWVDGDRAAAHNYDPMEFDPSGDYLAGRLERSDARPK